MGIHSATIHRNNFVLRYHSYKSSISEKKVSVKEKIVRKLFLTYFNEFQSTAIELFCYPLTWFWEFRTSCWRNIFIKEKGSNRSRISTLLPLLLRPLQIPSHVKYSSESTCYYYILPTVTFLHNADGYDRLVFLTHCVEMNADIKFPNTKFFTPFNCVLFSTTNVFLSLM
jgi:hypothetical protein